MDAAFIAIISSASAIKLTSLALRIGYASISSFIQNNASSSTILSL